MSFRNITQLANIIKTAEDNTEQLSTAILLSKINKLAKTYEDKTVGAMFRVIGNMVDNNKNFISKAEFQKLYKQLYTNNTRFASEFAQELGVTQENIQEDVVQPTKSVELNPYVNADPILANALSCAFDNKEIKMYSEKFATNALRNVGKELNSIGLKPRKLEVSDGNESFLVIKADFDTPKGITSFYIPVDTMNSASVFMGNEGIKEISAENIKDYILKNAGSRLNVKGSTVLNLLKQATTPVKEISDIEYALIKLNAQRNHSEYMGGIVGQKIAEAKPSFKDPKFEDIFSFEKEYTSPQGKANFQFGDKVKLANDVIIRELKGFGFTPQVKITNANDTTVYYGVSIGKIAFTVPMKMEKVSKPDVMICNGSLKSFNYEEVSNLIKNNETDFAVYTATSVYNNLNAEQLLEQVKTSTFEGNLTKAEEVLAVLSEKDQASYLRGLQVMLKGLNSEAKNTPKTSCSKPIKLASSSHPICSHTGLPLHKVKQDKHNNCIALTTVLKG